MRWTRAASGLVLGLATASSCSSDESTPGPLTAPIPDLSAASTCGGGVFLEAPFHIKEGTHPEIEGWRVGVSNIGKRDVTDATGTSGQRLTAQVARVDAKTQRPLDPLVAHAGMTLELGRHRYCITSITDSKRGARGKLTLRRLE